MITCFSLPLCVLAMLKSLELYGTAILWCCEMKQHLYYILVRASLWVVACSRELYVCFKVVFMSRFYLTELTWFVVAVELCGDCDLH